MRRRCEQGLRPKWSVSAPAMRAPRAAPRMRRPPITRPKLDRCQGMKSSAEPMLAVSYPNRNPPTQASTARYHRKFGGSANPDPRHMRLTPRGPSPQIPSAGPPQFFRLGHLRWPHLPRRLPAGRAATPGASGGILKPACRDARSQPWRHPWGLRPGSDAVGCWPGPSGPLSRRAAEASPEPGTVRSVLSAPCSRSGSRPAR